MNPFAQWLLTLSAVLVGLPIARLLDNEFRRRLRERRHEHLKRAVIAEPISRGIDVAAVDLQQLSHDLPPRVTSERVQAVVDQIEAWMRYTTPHEEHPDG